MHHSGPVGAALLLVSLVLSATLAGCKTRGGGQVKPGTTGLTGVGGFLEMKGLYRTRKQSSKTGAPRNDSEEMVLAENVGLETDGFVYHPNILEFTAGAVLGLFQSRFDSSPRRSEASGDSGSLLEYDLTANFLNEKIYPGFVNAHRFEGLEPRPFQSSTRRTTTDYGVEWQYLGEKMPTRVYWSLSDVFYSPLGTLEEDRFTSDEQVGVDSEFVFSPTNKLSFDYRRQSSKKTTETHSYDVEFDIDDASLRHLLLFGSQDQSRLNSDLRLFKQRGTTDLDRTQLTERLDLRHTEDFRSWYLLDLMNRRRRPTGQGQTVEEDSWLASAALEHRLYDNLTTEVGAEMQQQVFDSAADMDRGLAYIDLDYYRNNPWGRLQVDARHARIRRDRSGFDQRIVIIDEPRTFVGFFPIILDQEGVLANTIFITDLSGTEIYQFGPDYTITTFVNRIEINRVPTGLIQEGQTVLLDYEILNTGEYALGTANTRFGVRQNFDNGIAPYYRLMVQDQEYAYGGENNTPAEDILSNAVGIEYRAGGFYAQAEYENYNSTVVPFRSYRLGGGYSHEFGGGKRAGLNARWMDLSYHEPNVRESTLVTIDASYRHPFNNEATFEAIARYIRDRDTINSDNEGIDLRLSQDWTYRSVEFRVTLEIGRFENNFVRNRANRAFFELRRRF